MVARKKNSACIWLCVDFSRFVKRERFQSTPPAIVVADIAGPKAKYFTILDALKGYHQCRLEKDSQLLTTFVMPFGRYKFMCAPFGLSSISEHYDRRIYEAFQASLTSAELWMMMYSSLTRILPVMSTMYASFYSGVRNEAFFLAVTSYGIVRRKSSLLVFIYPRMAIASVMTLRSHQ